MDLEKRKIGIIASAICVVGASTLGYSLAENKELKQTARNFSVNIPIAIPLMQDSTGATIVAKNLPIQNNGDDSVVIKTLSLKPAAGFSISEEDSSLPANSFNLSVDGVFASSSNGVVIDKQPVINKGQGINLPLAVKAGNLGEKGHRNIGTLEYEFAWEIQGVRVKQEPNKKDYKAGDTFEKGGLVLETVRGDGKPGTEITADNIVIKDGDSLVAGQDKVTAEVVVNGQKHTIDVGGLTVDNVTIVGIEVVRKPNKKVYNEGDRIVLDGIVVRTKLSDGSDGDEVPIGSITVTDDADGLTVGKTSFNISVSIGGQIFNAEVPGITVVKAVGKLVDKPSMDAALKTLRGKLTFVTRAYKGNTGSTNVYDISARNNLRTVYAVIDPNGIDATIYAAGGILPIEYSGSGSGMFNGYQASEMDLTGIDLSKLSNGSYMFYNTSRLTKIDYGKNKFTNLEQAAYMFSRSAVTSFDFNEVGMGTKLKNATALFRGSKIESFSMAGYRSEVLTTRHNVYPAVNPDWFTDCKNLISVDMSNMYLPKINTVVGMFKGCSSLVSFDMSSTTLARNVHYTDMFNGATALQSVNLKNINAPSAGSSRMFQDCVSLQNLDLSYFEVYYSYNPNNKLSTVDDMFKGCNSLQEVKARNDTDLRNLKNSKNCPRHINFVIG